MATREEIAAALRNADAAGDTKAAQTLAAALTNYTDENTIPSPPPNGIDVYKQMPLWQKAMMYPADSGRLIASGATLGGYDKLAGKLLGPIGAGDVSQQRAMTQQARDRGGFGGTMLETASSLLPMVATEGATTLPAMSDGMMKTLTALGIGGLEGAGYGGIQAVNNDRDVFEGMKSGFGYGTAGQAAAGLLSKAGSKFEQMFSKKPPRMTVDNLKAAKDQAYAEAANTGVQYTPSAVRGILADMDAAAQPYPGRHDAVIATRRQVGTNLDNGNRPVTLTEMDRNRQIINRDTGNLEDRAQRDMGQDYKNAMDDALSRMGPQDVTVRSGDPATGLDQMINARNLNSRMEKLDSLTQMDYKSGLQADKSINQGKDSTLKNNVASILTNPKKRRGYTPDEIAQMEEVVQGTPMSNIGRQLGRLAPGGGASFIGASGAAGLAGAMSGYNPIITTAASAIPLGIGYVGKKLGERSTEKSAQQLLDIVAAGGKKPPKPTGMSAQDRDNLGRILMMMQIGNPNNQ